MANYRRSSVEDLLETKDFGDVSEVERVAIAAILKGEESKNHVLQHLSSDRFFDQDLAKIFDKALNLYINGVHIDTNTLGSELNKRQRRVLEACAEMEFAESSVSHICKKVIEESNIRDVHSFAEDMKMLTIDPKNTHEDIVGNLHSKVMALMTRHSNSRTVTPGEIVDNVLLSILNRKGGELGGITSGLESFDKEMGPMPQALTLLAARPGMGKTHFGLQMAVENAMRGTPVLFVSLEMPEEKLMERVLSRLARVNSHKLKIGTVTDDELKRLEEVVPICRNMPLYMETASSLSIAELRAKARTIDLQTKGNLGLVIVDYIQLMSGAGGTRNEEVASISAGLRQMALDMRIPVVGLSQLNRGVEARENKRPSQADLRDSGSLEQDAHMIMFLYREFVYSKRDEQKRDLEIIVDKNRDGPVKTINAHFEGEFSAITDVQEGRLLT